MSGLRFCFLTTFYPPYNFGGDGIGIRRLAHGLVRRGHRVTVVHDADAYNMLSDRPDPDPIEEPEGLDVVTLRSGFGSLSCLLTQQTGRPVMNGRRIRELLAEGDFDVVNFHNVSLIGGPGLLEYGADSVRLYTAHEHWLVCPMHVLWRHGRELCDGRECVRCTLNYRRPPQAYRFTGAMDRNLESVDTYLAMSEFSRDKHHEFGFAHDMEVVPYFLPDPDDEVDGPTSASPHPRPYFLFVGRLEKIKGLQDVIPLFAGPGDVDLVVAGDGEYGGELRSMAEGMERVHFLGRVSQEVLRAYYGNCLALVVPSLCYETFGIILIEAFSHGAPVIARRLGPFPEIVETSGGGELFETTDELRRAMERIRTDDAHRTRLAEQGHRAFRERWVESAVVPRYLDVVRRTAERLGKRYVIDSLDRVEST